MASCESGALQSIFEVVCIAGGLRGKEIITATSTYAPRLSVTALVISSGDIFLYCHKDGRSTVKLIPWLKDEAQKPTALAFNPTAEWLLVATKDGSVCIIPIGKFIDGINTESDHRFPTNDAVIYQPNGSRAKPTAVVWWQTITGEASLAIVGTELGELCFVELTSGKDVGGTYITVPVRELFLCRDNSLDTVYLLITGTEDRQWRLVLEQKSNHYMFPLENISPEWVSDEPHLLSAALHQSSLTSPSPRSRLMGLKQLSVEKLQLLKQRLAEAKHSSKKKPLTENKGVDTCDIDEVPSVQSFIIAPQLDHCVVSTSATPPLTSTCTVTAASLSSKPVTPGIDAAATLTSLGETESTTSISARPERLNKYIYDVVATPQYAKDRYLLAGHYKPSSCLMVYSTDLENTPLYVFKLPEDTRQIVLHDEMIFVTSTVDPSKLCIVSTFFSASSRIDGEIDARINPVVQDIYLTDEEEILNIFPAPPFLTHGDKDEKRETDSEDDNCETEIELPSHTKPNGCLIVTKSALYLCQPRKSIENLFMELTLSSGDIEAANKLGVIFSLDPKLFELAADAKLRNRSFAAAIALYKHSRCPHVKCTLKFAWAGFVPEFLTYMSSLMNAAADPDLGFEQRRHLGTLSVLAHMYQLSLPAGVRTLQQQQTTLRNILLLLRNNMYYDELLTLVVAAATWRWESLQYLASTRGLLLEKLHALLCEKYTSVMLVGSSSQEDKYKHNASAKFVPMCREKETGYWHCLSDPELRGILLCEPNLARRHMAFILDHLDSLDISVLRRLAALYDPTHPAIQPFISASLLFQKTNIYTNNQKFSQPTSFLPPASNDPVGLDTLTQVFLAVLIKLNEKRGWKYNPDVLNLGPTEPTKKKPFFDNCIHRNVLACGYGHSVVITGGLVYSWGLGDFGVLGHGPKSLTPSKLLQGIDQSLSEELKELTELNSPSPELIFSTVMKSEASTPSGETSEMDCCEPRAISYLKNMKVYQLACGKNHVLAITDYGVYGWGSNRYGQIGTGSTGRHPRPTLIRNLIDKAVVHVACGQFHSLCLANDGRLYTWGWGVHGQLGHSNVEDCLKPTLVKKLSRKKVVQASGGYAHSVALTSKGTVYAWGCSTYGQVGTGGILKVTIPSRVPICQTVTHLIAGYFHNIASTEDHKVYTWGSNPACLRVQAQVQRRNRSLQQQKPQENNSCSEGSLTTGTEASTVANNSGDNNDDTDAMIEIQETDTVRSPNDNKSQTHEDPDSVQNVPTSDDNAEEISETGNVKENDSADTDTNTSELGGKQCCDVKSHVNCHLVSANTVPSCDPLDLGHLLPKEVDMPHGYGVVKSLAAGNQHSLLLTTHGALYSWGRNMSGQLGTGNRKESLNPVRILDDVYITKAAAGSDFNLAFESNGQLWGWGSNYYSQLAHGIGCSDDKGQPGKVFMLRTSKRVLKVPHSVQSNVETPRPIASLPIVPVTSGHTQLYSQVVKGQMIDLSNKSLLNGVHLATLESSSGELPEKDIIEDKDDGLYGTATLHSSLYLLHPHYAPKNVAQMLLDCNGHQALATLYTLERQHSKAMHHQLCALLSHKWLDDREEGSGPKIDNASQENQNISSREPLYNSSTVHSCCYSNRHVNEAVRILDHYLRLQTEESQSGMRGVLQEGIGLWLTHSLPIPQLEDLLLTHLPRTVYPLALLLFGEEATSQNKSEESDTSQNKSQESESETRENLASRKEVEEATARVLSQLSTKFCLNLCSSVISHLQTGECNVEQLDALSQLVKGNPSAAKDLHAGMTHDAEVSPYNTFMESLSKHNPNVKATNKEETLTSEEKLNRQIESSAEEATTGARSKKDLGKRKSVDKESVHFTCGHHFTTKDFKTRVLPQLERTVTTVPGLLGKTARVLLDQYHTDQPQMACPHCVLAHLTIKLTKHNQPSP